ncbi:MAG: winged helix-turn-helix domain-containing protein [Rhodoglobus sp.]
MSLATIERTPRTSFAPAAPALAPTHAARELSLAVQPSRDTRPAAAPAPAIPAAEAPRLRAVPQGTEARGFVLYVGIDELKAAAAGTDLSAIVEQLKLLTQQLVPGSETHAAVALAPVGAGGRDVDVVRLALQDPSALAKHRQLEEPVEKPASGVVVDLSRKRVLIDDEPAALTYKEFELLQFLILRESQTIDRAQLISTLWSAEDDEAPNERTIDVHIRRLRSKLGAYEDVVRTVRGIGYRYDRHPDVSVRFASTPSPDFI